MYPGETLLKNLNMFTEMHCKNISFMGRQLIFLSSFIPTRVLLSRLKQHICSGMFELFWTVFYIEKDARHSKHNHSKVE